MLEPLRSSGMKRPWQITFYLLDGTPVVTRHSSATGVQAKAWAETALEKGVWQDEVADCLFDQGGSWYAPEVLQKRFTLAPRE